MDFRKLLENKMFMTLMSVIAGIIVIIIVVSVIVSFSGKKVSGFAALEERLVAAAKNYYADNKGQLPVSIGETDEVSATTLSEGKYIKPLDKISPKGSICSGRVVVKNGNGNYLYQAYVDCGDKYQTKSFASQVKADNQVVTSGSGLYDVNGKLVYRGEKVNNYVTFAGQTYQIVQINGDNTVDIVATGKRERAVWDNRYNQDRGSNDGINDYSISRIRDTLLNYINSEVFTDNDRLLLEPFSVCVGKVDEESPITYGQECANVVEGQLIGLLPISAFTYASLDPLCQTPGAGNCQNYNYLTSYDYNWWTSTADSANSYRVYQVYGGSSASSNRASASAVPREVLRLSDKTVFVSGNGTITSPYVIK